MNGVVFQISAATIAQIVTSGLTRKMIGWSIRCSLISRSFAKP